MNQRGFTLIEMMIAVAIVGILVATGIAAYQQYRVRALDTAAVSDARHLAVFESQFYNDYLVYVPLQPSDKDASGHIFKTVVVPDGSSQDFRVDVLTKDIQILCNTDALNQSAIVAAFHSGGAHIVALEIGEDSAVHAKKFAGTLTNADVPASTTNPDLTGWPVW